MTALALEKCVLLHKLQSPSEQNGYFARLTKNIRIQMVFP